MTLSQWLTVIGLVFEFISVLITVRKLFYGYYKRLENEILGPEINKDRNEGIVVIIFLVIGMVFQGIAVLV